MSTRHNTLRTNKGMGISDISPEVRQTVEDGQRLICYISRGGDMTLDAELTQSFVAAKYKLLNNDWTEKDEHSLFMAYDKLASMVYPVTIDTINAVIPKQRDKKRPKTQAESAVTLYRVYALGVLFTLVFTQIYWLFGNDLHNNLKDLFDSRESTILHLTQTKGDEQQQKQLQEQLKVDNQRLDANYRLLLGWSRVWSLGTSFEYELPKYFQQEYELKRKRLLENEKLNLDAIEALELQRSMHEVRIVFFEHILSAEFILSAFQNYVLPLLYGLLGSLIFVLRELAREIKSLTYGFDSEIRYRLRITLGALGGLVIGWILRVDDELALVSMSPMAMAFLMGYNVEVLFSIMDKVIDNIRNSIDKPKDASHQVK
ncbi:hypothetical protein KIH87_14565 [Paraneptunicella aestuarii]|uniref:hypothetical protein n=1 Tax=Paraneptunicella aestuarii TaxID=2831148 RepID=UPI001E3B14F2|nr:hypothetical protein [Paraneptunicella aestuarii]UAA37907.1 hypothetical protein KIH87_14565 [Paraneptunicella aestuarii]